jgi:hypothetical protein
MQQLKVYIEYAISSIVAETLICVSEHGQED